MGVTTASLQLEPKGSVQLRRTVLRRPAGNHKSNPSSGRQVPNTPSRTSPLHPQRPRGTRTAVNLLRSRPRTYLLRAVPESSESAPAVRTARAGVPRPSPDPAATEASPRPLPPHPRAAASPGSPSPEDPRTPSLTAEALPANPQSGARSCAGGPAGPPPARGGYAPSSPRSCCCRPYP